MDGILLINKTTGMTSHDVVMKIRKLLKTKKVGHCGTLDPDATGVLVICVNKATKAIQFLTADSKEYIATLSLGKSTDTYDASGKVLEEKEFNGIKNLEEVLNSFVGKQKQLPPIYSAIKVNGKKLYEYARENKEVEIKPRDIEIKEIELLKVEDNEITFRVLCSKGTYIRSLCVDIANKLGYPGHMKSLMRSQSGDFKLEDCFTLEDVEQGNYRLISMDEAFTSFDKMVVDEKIVIYGKTIKSDIDHNVAVYSEEGKLLAIYGPDGKGYLKSIRGLF
ncbi:MAG: tRNA pseudouridine(55) synthase TruB [Bacilli bacterium]|nr:tRNA pseudouridine(55) synthase TruB [Bacilli bacterium]